MQIPCNKQAVVAAIAGSLVLTACSNSDTEDPIVETDVTVLYAAQVNGADFTCGQTYTGIGTGPHNLDVNDFRMYINDVHIHNTDSDTDYPVELAQDGVWQQDDVVMLDFEDASNGCTGTAETNDVVVGTVTAPASVDLADTEICFEVGLPEDKNHIDEATAASPLNASGMLWAWKIGRKFVRIDMVGDPAGVAEPFNIHLGSQGCPGSSATAPPDSSCTVPNTFKVCIANFDLENDVIAVDPAFVLEANDVSTNLVPNVMSAGAPKPGCQSFIGDDDCEEIMPRLGLDYDYGRSSTGVKSTYVGDQRLFSKQ